MELSLTQLIVVSGVVIVFSVLPRLPKLYRNYNEISNGSESQLPRGENPDMAYESSGEKTPDQRV